MPATATPAPEPRFWRDAALPFIEARSVHEGRKICYAKHSHDTLSVGAIMGGRSTYLNRNRSERVGAGMLVVMNPDDVHACNPVDDLPWSYRMFYVDRAWIGALQRELGFAAGTDFNAFSSISTHTPALFSGFNTLYATLTSPHAAPLEKHGAAIAYFSDLQTTLHPAPLAARASPRKLERAAEFINDNYTQALQLDDICDAAELSASYLIRAFKKHYGMTPHAYLMNRRIQFGRAQLRRGQMIADVAFQAGFADQAHFQRVFKEFMAVTPGQYRR